MKKYDVAAYVWPSYTGDEGRTRIFWPEGYGEWETVKAAKPLYEGHQWPRKPLWGYVNEADPYVMEMEIEAAVDHGINVFIYDWYWYDDRPFLEQCLDNGFLKAKNRSKMKFYLMLANHDVTYIWDRRIATLDYDSVIWNGALTPEQFRTVGKRWIDMYFGLPEYYTIDNEPVVSVYDMKNFVQGLGGIENAKKEMEWLNDEVKKLGFAGVHFQFIKIGNVAFAEGEKQYTYKDLTEALPLKSFTNYQFVHFANVNRNYNEILEDAKKEWERAVKEFDVPYFPHVSLGWDNTPRYKTHIDNVVKNNTPEEIEKALIAVRDFADKNNVGLITINSWNEWTETSYLQPDDLYGYGYLEAVKKVFGK